MGRSEENVVVESWDLAYRKYQETLARRYLIPTLEAWSVSLEGRALLEVGCGDGGCAAEFHREGCRVTALDIDDRLVGISTELNRRDGLEINTYVGDITREDCPGLHEGPFDLIVLRDVVEHIETLQTALRIMRVHLNDRGVMFVVFPPYYSPYGGHQQILPRKKLGFIPYNKLPYLQLLPNALFNRIIAGESPANSEVARLRGIRLTLSRFERETRAAGFEITQRKLYLSRPTFSLRYGMPVIGASFLGRVPGLRELVTTAGYFLLGKS